MVDELEPWEWSEFTGVAGESAGRNYVAVAE